MKKYVYLAGPILGCTGPEANHWRKSVCEVLKDHGIIGISPLRCEPLIGERYTMEYPDPRFGVPRAIAAKNFHDVINCDMTLAYMPLEMGENISLGTVVELAWAKGLNKQVILVSDHPKVLQHPVIDACVNWKLGTLEEAVDVMIGVLGGYTGGKNV